MQDPPETAVPPDASDPPALPSPDPPATWTADRARLEQELVQAQKMEALGQLVSGVAHELNNPLAAIIAFSQLLQRDPRLPEDMRHDADLLVQEADRTRRIVQNLLDFARQRPPERHPTPLGALVASILDLQSYLISSSQVAVDVDIPADVPPVPLDRAQMQQVLLNVTLNAIQAIRTRGAGGRIWIRAELDDRAPVVRLAVTDDGPGVDPEHHDQLFVPFFTTKPPGEGTGLGLPVSFGIVAAHGGRLTFEPADGGGARFVIELPLASRRAGETRARLPGGDGGVGADAAGAAGRAGNPPSWEQDAPTPTGRPRILVIDDEPSIRRFITKALEIAGCEAVLAEHGPQALDLVRDGPFAAALCDHRMAGMTGTQVYEAVVAMRPELATRFVFMSGDVLNPSLRDFAETRGLSLLAKPFDIESVGRTIRAVIDREAAQPRG